MHEEKDCFGLGWGSSFGSWCGILRDCHPTVVQLYHRVGCTDTETITWEQTSIVNQTVSYGSETTTQVFTTTTNTSATVGHTTVSSFTLPPAENGWGNAVRSCTFIR